MRLLVGCRANAVPGPMKMPNDLEALRSGIRSKQDTRALRAIVVSLFDAGVTRKSLLDGLEHLRKEFRDAGDDEAEDAILEVMDYLVGWCSPHMQI